MLRPHDGDIYSGVLSGTAASVPGADVVVDGSWSYSAGCNDADTDGIIARHAC